MMDSEQREEGGSMDVKWKIEKDWVAGWGKSSLEAFGTCGRA